MTVMTVAPTPPPRVPIDVAGRIKASERDYALGLHNQWPTLVDSTIWRASSLDAHPQASYLTRQVDWNPPTDSPRRRKEEHPEWEFFVSRDHRPLSFEEFVLRFPSAPVYDLHRKPRYRFTLPDRINLHTLRLLRTVDPRPVSRIFLFQNGLNEIEHLAFYYKLAALLIDADPTTACIIRPFPGHLTRHPFPDAYAERPLDRYLLDAGDLFRQFLRYMLETQWLLSILTPVRDYRVVAGLDLLAPDQAPEHSRENTEVLTGAIYNSWVAALEDSKRRSQDRAARERLSDTERQQDRRIARAGRTASRRSSSSKRG